MMEYRQPGRSGIKVSALTLGTMMFGESTDDVTAARIVDKAFEQGVNSIDTADAIRAANPSVWWVAASPAAATDGCLQQSSSIQSATVTSMAGALRASMSCGPSKPA